MAFQISPLEVSCLSLSSQGVFVKFGLCSEPSTEELALAAAHILEAEANPVAAAPSKLPSRQPAPPPTPAPVVAGLNSMAPPPERAPELDPLQQLMLSQARPAFVPVVPDGLCVAGQRTMGSMQQVCVRGCGAHQNCKHSS